MIVAFVAVARAGYGDADLARPLLLAVPNLPGVSLRTQAAVADGLGNWSTTRVRSCIIQ